MKNPERYDIAIIGGGIAGLYCGLNAPPGLRVALFEATDRFGGKLETVSTGGFLAEYGSMRFDPGKQPVMSKLIEDLGLETEPFPEYCSPPASERQAIYGLEATEKSLNALELFALGIRRVLGLSEPELMTAPEEELEHLRRFGKHRDRPMWEQGLWNVFADVLSYDAIKYIMSEGSFFHGIHENPGVVGTMLTWVKMLQMSKYLKGIKGGMQLITDRMLERVKQKGISVYTGHSLEALAPAGGNGVSLAFNSGEFSAGRVILALPSSALKALRGIPRDIRKLLDTVMEYPLLKCFFVVDDPWWEETIPNKGANTIPTRELHYYRQADKGMIMVYADRPGINFWSEFVISHRHDRAETGCHSELPLLFARQLKIRPETITAYGIRDWTRPPYGAGVHLWRPGVEPWKVSERLAAFSLQDGSPRNVHICGEAFSDFQGFMEGAVRSARCALERAPA